MYTLEYQMSYLAQFDDDLDSSTPEYNEASKLCDNISHLQDCISKKFEEFNSKIDGK